MKFSELQDQRLEWELQQRGLPTDGNNLDMKRRLYKEFNRLGIDIYNYEFTDNLDTYGMKNNIDFNSKFDAIMVKMEEISTEVKNHNEMIFSQMNARYSIAFEILENASRATNEMLMNRFVAADLQYNTIAEKLHNIESKFDYMVHRLNSLEAKMANVQMQEIPSFDGSIPLKVFKFQFETVANKNGWSMNDKCKELILALKGSAAEILQTVPVACRNSYEDIMAALQHKYGNDYDNQIHKVELRIQEPNESLQDFALEIERLVSLAYPGGNHPLLENVKTEAFVSGIRDEKVKLALYAFPRPSFTETVSLALSQYAANSNAKPEIVQAQSYASCLKESKIISEFEDFKRELRDLRNQLFNIQNNPGPKCFKCGRSGHFKRDCK